MNADDCYRIYVTYTSVRSIVGIQQQKQAQMTEIDVADFITFPGGNDTLRAKCCQLLLDRMNRVFILSEGDRF